MQKFIQIKSFFLLIVFSIITIHNTLPHFHHSHEITEQFAVEEIEHHSHDSEEQSEENEDNLLLTLLLDSHAHDTEVQEDSEILVNYNKVLVGKDLPIITLYTLHRIPPDIAHTPEKKHFQYKQHFLQEQLALNCPLRAPPTLG